MSDFNDDMFEGFDEEPIVEGGEPKKPEFKPYLCHRDRRFGSHFCHFVDRTGCLRRSDFAAAQQPAPSRCRFH